MRILVYGAGVIGSIYAVLMSEVGYGVTVLARGKRLTDLSNNGLRYYKKGKVEIANITVIDRLEDSDKYDYIFLPVRTEQLKQALCELKSNKSPNIVTMVNTLEKYEELEKICGVNRLIPAFPGAGGSIDNGILNASLTPKIIQPTTFGEISKRKTDRIAELAEIFRKSHIPYQIVSDMHNWQISHLGMVVPIADAYYMSSSPETVYENKAIMKKTAKQMKDNFKILAKHKILSPFKFYLFMICPTWVFTIILSAVFKSKFGHKFMYEHSMNAPQEMRQLHTEFYDFISWNIV
ncbi:ketopantoate reductase family protein [Lachnospiraceae bacterium HCP1S3_C3]